MYTKILAVGFFVFTSLTYPAGADEAHLPVQILGQGLYTCSEWNKSDVSGKYDVAAWLLGFLSGMNTAFTTATERSIDVSNGMEPSAALILMQDYCIANPEVSVGVAAAEVTAKLIGKGDDVLGQGDAERHLAERRQRR